MVRRLLLIASLHTGLYGTCAGSDYRPTYPDSCPWSPDGSSRLCLPKWQPTYDMAMSTIIMPCNYSDYYSPMVAARYGIVDFDWSNAKDKWANSRPMDCEERLLEQAHLVKQSNPRTKVWVYRNLVKALPWYSSVREKLCDPQYEGWFLKFDPKVSAPHVPKCDDDYSPPKCTEFYHDQLQTPHHPTGRIPDDGSCHKAPCDCGCVPCGEYLWNHRNQSLRHWLVNEHVTGKSSIESPDIDGVFTDDEWSTGPSEEDDHSVQDMGLSKQDVAEMTGNWTLSMKAMHQAVLDKGGFAWRLFVPGSSTGGSDPVGGQKLCLRSMRTFCGPTANNSMLYSAMMMNAGGGDDFEPNLAAFLILRGPYAWFGHAWEGCGIVPPRPPVLDADYGEPQEAQCRETEPGRSGVFVREWTKATVQLDCGNWKGAFLPKAVLHV